MVLERLDLVNQYYFRKFYHDFLVFGYSPDDVLSFVQMGTDEGKPKNWDEKSEQSRKASREKGFGFGHASGDKFGICN